MIDLKLYAVEIDYKATFVLKGWSRSRKKMERLAKKLKQDPCYSTGAISWGIMSRDSSPMEWLRKKPDWIRRKPIC